MNKQRKSIWQKLREEYHLSVPVILMWGIFIVFIISTISKHYQIFFSYLFFVDLIDSDRTNNVLDDARNLFLILAALLAFPLAIHRTVIASKHAKTAQKQLETSQEQVETAQEQLRASQKQLAQSRTEMRRTSERAVRQKREREKSIREDAFKEWQNHLFSGNENLQRIAVDMLWKLAQECPEDYHIQTMDNFHSLIRSIETITDEVPTNPRTMALKKLVNQGNIKTKGQKKVEADYEFRSNLQFLNFKNLDLSYSDLSNIDFRWTLWENVNVSHTDLTGATFEGCFLKNISFLETPTVENALWENVFIDVFEAKTVYFPNHVRDAIAEKNLALEELVKWLARRGKAVKNASS